MINNDKEALTHALILSITAPNDKLNELMQIAQEIESRLSNEEIEACRRKAIAWISAMEMEKRDQNKEVIH
jgi:UDP-N-acetylmuramyl tripeptide synthase